MKQQNLDDKFDDKIRTLFAQEATQTKIHDDMYEKIAARLENEEQKNGNQSNVNRKSTGKLCVSKRVAVVLAATFVIAVVAFAGMKKTGTNGVYGIGSVYPETTDFTEFPKVATELGYPNLQLSETLPGGYTFTGVWLSTVQQYDERNQKMTKTYNCLHMEYIKEDGMTIRVSVEPNAISSTEGYETSNRLEEIYEWDGVTVYQTLYVAIEPSSELSEEHWMDELTEEQLRLVEENIAGVYGPGIVPYTVQRDIHSFTWQEDGYVMEVSAGYGCEEMVTVKELRAIAKELVELNQ